MVCARPVGLQPSQAVNMGSKTARNVVAFTHVQFTRVSAERNRNQEAQSLPVNPLFVWTSLLLPRIDLTPLTIETAADAVNVAETLTQIFNRHSPAFQVVNEATGRTSRTRPAGTVVVPGVRNANPEGAISWANLLIDYGRWLDVLPAPGDARTDPEARLLVREQLSSVLRALPTLTTSERSARALATSRK